MRLGERVSLSGPAAAGMAEALPGIPGITLRRLQATPSAELISCWRAAQHTLVPRPPGAGQSFRRVCRRTQPQPPAQRATTAPSPSRPLAAAPAAAVDMPTELELGVVVAASPDVRAVAGPAAARPPPAPPPAAAHRRLLSPTRSQALFEAVYGGDGAFLRAYHKAYNSDPGAAGDGMAAAARPGAHPSRGTPPATLTDPAGPAAACSLPGPVLQTRAWGRGRATSAPSASACHWRCRHSCGASWAET